MGIINRVIYLLVIFRFIFRVSLFFELVEFLENFVVYSGRYENSVLVCFGFLGVFIGF